ncbi:MAG: leucyl/phenylalanyl-tRNA--protein transferase [Gammaproteobacteria bacterium]
MTALSKNQARDSQLYWVADNIIAPDFPPTSSALRDPNGLLAIGGTLDSGRIIDAYRRGIFPWYSEGQPVLWWSPNPRCVLEPDELKISKSLAKVLRRDTYKTTFNQAFAEVIRACAAPRQASADTWLTGEMIAAYTALHATGRALSVECWQGQELVGGLYGLVIGRVFFGESMFSRKRDASKVALVNLVSKLRQHDFRLIDCQIHSPHLQSLGAKPIPRELFVNILKHYCQPDIAYQWGTQ